MQKARRHPIKGLRPLVGARFQRYWFAIGLSVVFSLGGWCRRFQTGFLRPRPTQDTATAALAFGYAAFTPCGRVFQPCSPGNSLPISLSFNPDRAVTQSVWAAPLSLAATRGITVVFSSSGYLDVSVPRVGSTSWCRAFRAAGSPIRTPAAGSPIRTPADLRPFAPPRGFSQLVTSFVASESQGIPRTPLIDFLVSSSNCNLISLSSATAFKRPPDLRLILG